MRKPWNNKLSDDSRLQIVLLYNSGFAVWNIMKKFNVAQTTVEWHLKQAGVLKPKRRATLFNRSIDTATFYRDYKIRQHTDKKYDMLPQRIKDLYRQIEREDFEIEHRVYVPRERINHYAVTVKELDQIPYKVMIRHEL